jgi:hypothetical protein
LSGAKERIRAARALSSQSLEFAVGELRALEAARAKAEARAATLEQQVMRTQRDMVILSRKAARLDEDEDAEQTETQTLSVPTLTMWQRIAGFAGFFNVDGRSVSAASAAASESTTGSSREGGAPLPTLKPPTLKRPRPAAAVPPWLPLGRQRI